MKDFLTNPIFDSRIRSDTVTKQERLLVISMVLLFAFPIIALVLLRSPDDRKKTVK